MAYHWAGSWVRTQLSVFLQFSAGSIETLLGIRPWSLFASFPVKHVYLPELLRILHVEEETRSVLAFVTRRGHSINSSSRNPEVPIEYSDWPS